MKIYSIVYKGNIVRYVWVLLLLLPRPHRSMPCSSVLSPPTLPQLQKILDLDYLSHPTTVHNLTTLPSPPQKTHK